MAIAEVLASNAIGSILSSCSGPTENPAPVQRGDKRSKRGRWSAQGIEPHRGGPTGGGVVGGVGGGGALGRGGGGGGSSTRGVNVPCVAASARAHPPADWWSTSSDDDDMENKNSVTTAAAALKSSKVGVLADASQSAADNYKISIVPGTVSNENAALSSLHTGKASGDRDPSLLAAAGPSQLPAPPPQSALSLGTTSGANSSTFVNHGLILWNQFRREWVSGGGKTKVLPRPQKLPVIRPGTTYDDLLSTSRPFTQPIPLPEMVDFLVEQWDDEGLYD
eukprot:TRINITY_DN2734_c0_g1_i2.p1 TRINITY_DN2734_c0_g1~~TRINITY_DN2734_c0_g1_i2.p1  ORF type:complete len:279 (-),score=68.07 TRINITY_DN2734_c0_g1_i2:307-1143(-)